MGPSRSEVHPGAGCAEAQGRGSVEERADVEPALARRRDALEWLTRGEWNAAYFLGLERLFHGSSSLDFTEQVIAGFRALLAAGCRFELFGREAHGVAKPKGPVTRPEEHSRACREVGEGTFDAFGRGRQALAWLRARAPELDVTWLSHVLEVYREAHSPDGGAQEEPSPIEARA